HVHQCGPRTTFEVIRAIAGEFDLPDERLTPLLEDFLRLDPETLKALGAYSLPAPPLHLVCRDPNDNRTSSLSVTDTRRHAPADHGCKTGLIRGPTVMSSNLAAAAKWYAGHGWPVFPLRPRDKRPLSEHGVNDATTDAEKIASWWAEDPNANV